MKRALFLPVAAAVALASLTGNADAARVAGVVVAKDAARHAVVVASPGAVRTLRTPSFRKLAVGRRVATRAAARPDGTFSAGRVRALGRANGVRFRAVVVANQPALRRLIVSAGGSVFAVRMRTGRSTASASGDDLNPGDQVGVDADVAKGGLEAGKDDVDELGHVEILKLEGIFLAATRTGFDLAVLKRGLVHVLVPEGRVVPDFRAGDQVALLVAVGDDGTFTFLKGIRDEGKRKEHPKGENEAHGVLSAKSPLSVTVKTEDGSMLTCSVPAGIDLSLFRVGEHVKLLCVSRDDTLVLLKLRSESGWVKGDGSGEASVHGVLAAKSATSVAVRREDGATVTCSVRAGLDLSLFRVGEKVKVYCNLEDGKLLLAEIRSDNAAVGKDGRVEVYASGVLAERSASSVAVRREDGSLFACAILGAPDLSVFRDGERVKLHCRSEGDRFVMLAVKSETYYVAADGSAELWTHGTVAERSESSIGVRREDGTLVTCTVPAGVDLTAFPVGTKAKLHCHLVSGAFRLDELHSETAEVKVPR